MFDAPGMNPTLLLLLESSPPCSAMCGNSGIRLSSAVPELVLNLDVELCSATTRDCRLGAYS